MVKCIKWLPVASTIIMYRPTQIVTKIRNLFNPKNSFNKYPFFWQLCIFAIPVALFAQSADYHLRGTPPLYTEFFNPDFPFFETTVDLREEKKEEYFRDNLIPRAVVIPLDTKTYVSFDTELLRVAAIWQGGALSPDSLAMRSYSDPLKKQTAGQKNLPKPLGKILVKTGLYPGWQHGKPSKKDPRSRGLDAKELGRGPLPSTEAQWVGTEDVGRDAILHYQILGVSVREHFAVETIKGQVCVVRSLAIESLPKAMTLVLSDKNEVQIEAGSSCRCIAYPLQKGAKPFVLLGRSEFPNVANKKPHWPTTIQSHFTAGKAQGAYALDELTIPYPNPWKRRIRPFAIDFFSNGDAAIVTFDGDVYRLTNLHHSQTGVTWQRIAAGFSEPASIRIIRDKVYVFSRNGITTLIDRDNDGETDFYRLVSNRFLQSGETRDYPLSLTPWQDDSWIITKGGQQNSHPSPHSGRVLQVPNTPNKEASFWAYGLRNGFINSIPERNLLVASDQQGHWVPATPFHIVKKGSFLGFEPSQTLDKTSLETEPAALWFPHRAARSGIDIVWCSDKRAGSLYQTALYLDYTNPSLHKIVIPEDNSAQTIALPLGLKVETPILKGAINPQDGLPYLTGFQIWDSVAKRQEGLTRLRVVENDDKLPLESTLFHEGLLLKFKHPLDPKVALEPSNYQISSWNYQRTENYGSGQFKQDGTPGIDPHFVHQPLLSLDKKSIFLAIEKLGPAMQYEAQFQLNGSWQQIYLSAYNLSATPQMRSLGFENLEFDKLFAQPAAKRNPIQTNTIKSALRGQVLSTQLGCIACHSIDGNDEGRSGPTWKGLFKKKRKLADGTRFTADDQYIREAILEPNKLVVPGYEGLEVGMPSYKGVLSESDLTSILLYITSLK